MGSARQERLGLRRVAVLLEHHGGRRRASSARRWTGKALSSWSGERGLRRSFAEKLALAPLKSAVASPSLPAQRAMASPYASAVAAPELHRGLRADERAAARFRARRDVRRAEAEERVTSVVARAGS